MSRGPGRLQREILVLLLDVPHLSIGELCSVIYRGAPITKSNFETVRMALKRLQAKKLIDQDGTNHGGEGCWTFTGKAVDQDGYQRLRKLRRTTAPRGETTIGHLTL